MKEQFTTKYLIFREIWKIFCVVQIFPVLYLNSLCFPCLEKVITRFPVFPVPWPPWVTFWKFCMSKRMNLDPWGACAGHGPSRSANVKILNLNLKTKKQNHNKTWGGPVGSTRLGSIPKHRSLITCALLAPAVFSRIVTGKSRNSWMVSTPISANFLHILWPIPEMNHYRWRYFAKIFHSALMPS